MVESDVEVVLSHYALTGSAVREIQPLANAGGWSGSRLWKVELWSDAEGVGNLCRDMPQRSGQASPDKDSRRLCLRRWPLEHPTAERLRLIHAVLGLVSFEMPLVAFPLRTTTGATFVELGGHLWELTHWMPGTADYHAHPNRARLKTAMRVLARFHDLARRYNWRIGPARSIEDRQRRIKEMQEKGLEIIEQSLRTPLDNEIDHRAVRLLTVAGKALETQSLAEALAAAPQLVLQPAIRDIHRDHVLFTGDEVTGLIDFGALRIDTPLADVARLVGSLVGDDQEARRVALDAYSELRLLSDADRRVVDVLDESGVVLGALNWLTWLYIERRDMGPVGPIVKRLDELLMRLES